MNVERLKILADYLSALPPENLVMDHFWEESVCGTSGCALGHAACIPEFKKLGMKLKMNGAGCKWGVPVYDDGEHEWEGIAAGATFFAMNILHASNIFGGSSLDDGTPNATPHEVAENINRMIATHDKENQAEAS